MSKFLFELKKSNRQVIHLSIVDRIGLPVSLVAAVVFALLMRSVSLEWEWLFRILLSCAVCYFATPFVMTVCHRFNILDIPGGRKMHSQPMPLLGGIAVYIAFAVTVLASHNYSWPMKGLAISSTLILVIGVIDDIWGAPALVRLLCQIIAASILIGFGVRMSFLPPGILGDVGEAGLTVLWLVGITNALNFMDGMDGLAAGLGVTSSLAFLVISLMTQQVYLLILSAALLGACLGFLRFNFKPAKIFLGDSGSNFIGFVLAGMAVMGTWAEDNAVIALSIPLLILGLIIYDIMYITVYRFRSGLVANFKGWIEYTGTDHLHHRLKHLGLGDRRAVVFIYLLAIFMSIGAITLKTSVQTDKYLILVMAVIVYVIITVLMELGRNKARQADSKVDE